VSSDGKPLAMSDGAAALPVRDWNLWVRDSATDQEKADDRRREVTRLRHRQRRGWSAAMRHPL
jgi:hypothetical protein